MDLEIIIPVKNEIKSLEALVVRVDSTMRENNLNYRMIFIDDHSTDGSFELLQSLSSQYSLIVKKKQGKNGKAYSILEGSRLATSEFLAILDADLQYPPESLPALLEIAKQNGVAVGNRKKSHQGRARALASRSFKFVFGQLLMNMNVDVQSGIKVFKREIATHLTEEDVSPWTFDMSLLSTARELGFNIGSIDIDFAPRIGGESKVSVGRASVEIGAHALKMRFKRNRTYRIHSEEGLKGAGVVHRKTRYITHTTLPHHISAMQTFTTWQKTFITVSILALVIGLLVSPINTAIAFIALLSFIYFLDVLFSAFVLSKSLHAPPEIKTTDEEILSLKDKDLPVYSVLCPLYKEAHILPEFVQSMNTLDWPKEKLEILLLLEEDDTKTIKAAQELNLPDHFKIVVVPHSMPKTKPKACNYGLALATGEYVVIYDAEDKPDPLQLKKVYLAFARLGMRYGCVQCKLNYYNPKHNLLTRLFTAEYSLWFDVILPGLQSIEGTIPLGGTSNHFRRDDLINFEAWDPFNVTEDCDLGVRLFKAGRKTAIVDSVTLEEANSNTRNWLRQRSRWIKGYFQTYLVHMRNPLQFFYQHRMQALIFQLVIGMRMTFMLINPFLWLTTIAYFAAYNVVGPTIESLFPPTVFYTAGFALIVGNFMYIYNYMIGLAKRGHWELIKYVFFIPFYWLLASIAASMAIWQLITKPHYWEKTNHGLHLGLPVQTDDELEGEVINASTPVQSAIIADAPKQNLFTKSFVLIATTGVVSVINLLYSAYLGRSLDFAEFGLLSTLASIITIVQIPLGTYASAVVHSSAKLFGKYGFPVKAFWAKQRAKALIPSILFSLAWLIAIPLLASFFNTNRLLPFVFITPLWLTGIFAAIDSGFLSGSHKFVVAALMSLVESITKFGLTFVFLNAGNPDLIYAAIPLSLVASFLVGWTSVMLIKSQSVSIPKRDLHTVSRKFMGSAFLTKLATVVFLSADVILAKHYLSAEDAGKYALISLVGKIIFFLGSLFSQFVNPLVSRNEGAGMSSKNTFRLLMGLTSLSTFAGFLAFGIGASYTLPFVLGEKILEVVPFLIPYTFAFGCVAIAGGIVTFHQARQQHSFSLISLFTAVYMIALIVLFHNSLYVISLIVSSSGVLYLVLALFLHFAVGTEDVKQTRPRRILIFNWRDTKHAWAGGAEVYVHEIAKSWVKEGLEVTLFCGNDGKSLSREMVDGVKVLRKGGHYTVYFWAFVYYILYLGKDCDVIVESTNGMPFFSPLYSNKSVFLLVYHVHQNVFREHLPFVLARIAMFIEKHLMPMIYRGGQIITISDSTKNDLVKLGLAEPEDIEIVSPGVDLSAYRQLPETPFPSFVYVGRLKHYKNIDIAILAFNMVIQKYPKAIFNIAGFGEMHQDLVNLVNKLGLTHAVKFLGKIDEYQKSALLAKSWVALQPSSIEGWGITVIEANAAGTPVIASKVPGLQDSVVDKVTGVLVDPKNVNAMAHEMINLIEDTQKRFRLAGEAKKWSQNFSWNNSANIFLKTIIAKKYI